MEALQDQATSAPLSAVEKMEVSVLQGECRSYPKALEVRERMEPEDANLLKRITEDSLSGSFMLRQQSVDPPTAIVMG